MICFCIDDQLIRKIIHLVGTPIRQHCYWYSFVRIE